MDNKIIVLIIIILLIVIGLFYVFSTQSSADNNLTLNNTTQLNTTPTSNVNTVKTNDNYNNNNNNTQNSTPTVKISPEQAQITVVGVEEDMMGDKVYAGKPELFKWKTNNKHTWVYNVNLYDIKTEKSVGSLYVDAMSGEVIMNE